MTHPGRTEGSRIDDMIDKLDKINNEDEPKTTTPATDFDDEMDHVLGETSPAKAEPAQTEAKEEPKPAKKAKSKGNGAETKPAPKKGGKAKSNGKDKKVVKKETKKETKKEPGAKRARARDPETVEIQKQVVTMLKRAGGKPVAVSKIVEKLDGKGDKAKDRQIRNALRGPQKDGLLAFTTVEGKKGFVKYIGA